MMVRLGEKGEQGPGETGRGNLYDKPQRKRWSEEQIMFSCGFPHLKKKK